MQERVAVPLAFVGVFSIILQCVGFFSQAWMIHNMKMNITTDWHRNSSKTGCNKSKDSSESYISISNKLELFSETNTSYRDKLTNSSETYMYASSMFRDLSGINTSTGDEFRNFPQPHTSTNLSLSDMGIIYEPVNVSDIRTNVSSNYSYEIVDNDNDTLGSDIGLEIHTGLWSETVCIYWSRFLKECDSGFTLKLEKKLATIVVTTDITDIRELLADRTAQRILVVGAGICAIAGLIFLLVFAKVQDKKVLLCGGITAATWFLSGILVVVAVGKQASDIHNYSTQHSPMTYEDTGSSITFHTPWAAVVSGVGGALAAFLAIGMTIYLACRDHRSSLNLYLPFVNIETPKARRHGVSQESDTTFL